MKKLTVLFLITLAVLIGLVYLLQILATKPKVEPQNQDVPVVEKPVINHPSNILGLKEALQTIGCTNVTAKPLTVSLDKNHSLSFNSIICKVQGDADYFTTNYTKVFAKDGKIYGTVSGANKEILKYWIFENENQVHDFIASNIKTGSDAVYCGIGMKNYGDVTEWFTEYNGPYTGNGVEPAENCGELFGLGAGAKMVFSQKNVLIQSELGTETMYRFDPESVVVR